MDAGPENAQREREEAEERQTQGEGVSMGVGVGVGVGTSMGVDWLERTTTVMGARPSQRVTPRDELSRSFERDKRERERADQLEPCQSGQAPHVCTCMDSVR